MKIKNILDIEKELKNFNMLVNKSLENDIKKYINPCLKILQERKVKNIQDDYKISDLQKKATEIHLEDLKIYKEVVTLLLNLLPTIHLKWTYRILHISKYIMFGIGYLIYLNIKPLI